MDVSQAVTTESGDPTAVSTNELRVIREAIRYINVVLSCTRGVRVELLRHMGGGRNGVARVAARVAATRMLEWMSTPNRQTKKESSVLRGSVGDGLVVMFGHVLGEAHPEALIDLVSNVLRHMKGTEGDTEGHLSALSALSADDDNNDNDDDAPPGNRVLAVALNAVRASESNALYFATSMVTASLYGSNVMNAPSPFLRPFSSSPLLPLLPPLSISSSFSSTFASASTSTSTFASASASSNSSYSSMASISRVITNVLTPPSLQQSLQRRRRGGNNGNGGMTGMAGMAATKESVTIRCKVISINNKTVGKEFIALQKMLRMSDADNAKSALKSSSSSAFEKMTVKWYGKETGGGNGSHGGHGSHGSNGSHGGKKGWTSLIALPEDTVVTSVQLSFLGKDCGGWWLLLVVVVWWLLFGGCCLVVVVWWLLFGGWVGGCWLMCG